MDAITTLARKFKNPEDTDRGEGHGRVYTLENARVVGGSQEWQERSIPLRVGLTQAIYNELSQLLEGESWDQAGSWDDFNQDASGGSWECHDPGWDWDMNQSPDHWMDDLPGGWEEKVRSLLEDIEQFALA